MTLDAEKWFTEVCDECGSAFSLRLGERLHDEQSPYQHIEIYQTERFGRLMVIDGFVMLTERDNFIYHEMLAHPALYSHPSPRNVLIIGGGDCGTLREVLRHPEVEQVTQVDIDERVTRLVEQHFPQLCESNDDPRATLAFDDGLQWVKGTASGSVDVVIVDSTDPIGPAEGLFGEAFYRDCHRVLGERGLIVQQSESPLVHLEAIIKPMHEAMGSAGFLDVMTLQFPQPVYPSGWWSATMACKDMTVMFEREEAAEAKPFGTQYYNAAVHRASMSMPEFFRQALYGF